MIQSQISETIVVSEEIAENLAIEFTEWLITYCDFQSHRVWEFQGLEYTQRELLDIFKKIKNK